MPTPNDDTLRPLSTATVGNHATCPPDSHGVRDWRDRQDRQDLPNSPDTNVDEVSGSTSPSPSLRTEDTPQPATDTNNVDHARAAKMEQIRPEVETEDRSSPASISPDPDTRESEPQPEAQSPMLEPSLDFSHTTSTSFEFSSTRLLPSYSSSYLRPGSRFVGTQQSDKQIYNVEVNIKHVNMAESSLCGYLRIEGLTKDHPTLTTYFDGEIIGPKYTFQTKHESWGSNEKTDMQHWDRFPAWRPLAKQAKQPDFHYKDCARRENVFMRWKEHFLVPNHQVKEINGASFDGFYYICFNQVVGSVSGIYFHAKSEKYQQLELKHVNDMGHLGSIEFR